MSNQKSTDTVLVSSGFIHVLRFYDVAFEIELPQVEEIARAQGPQSSRVRLVRFDPKSISFAVPPVELRWGKLDLPLEDEIVPVEVICRVYDFGVLSVAFRLSTADLPWQEFQSRLNRVAKAAGTNSTWQDAFIQVRNKVNEVLAAAYTLPLETGVEEDYLVAEVRSFSPGIQDAEKLNELDLVPVLSGETRPLSAAARSDLLKHRYSYYTDDLVALTWDRAFVYEPSGDTGVLDVLQMANAQLVELRHYDERLDHELPQMHDQVQEAHATLRAWSRGKYSRLARSLYTLVAEVVEVRERLDNALRITEDVYLARVHSAATKAFRVADVESAVERKLAIVRDSYKALYDEAATERAEALEMAIVLLFVLDIVMMIFAK